MPDDVDAKGRRLADALATFHLITGRSIGVSADARIYDPVCTSAAFAFFMTITVVAMLAWALIACRIFTRFQINDQPPDKRHFA